VFAPGFDSERLTRLCGTGVPFRPLFCPIPSCNVPGLKNSFQLRPRDTCGRPHRDSNYPDKQGSIRKKTCSVKLSSKPACGNKSTSPDLARLACTSHPIGVLPLKLSGPASISLKRNNSKTFRISRLQDTVCHLTRVTQSTAVFA
jgi:hypothetical protein